MPLYFYHVILEKTWINDIINEDLIIEIIIIVKRQHFEQVFSSFTKEGVYK